jgi:hypothetical protein
MMNGQRRYGRVRAGFAVAQRLREIRIVGP